MNVVISQSDVVTAYGWGIDALWEGLMSGQTAIRPTDRFAERGFVSNQAAMIPDLKVGANETRAWAMLERLLEPLVGKIDPETTVILSTTVGEIEQVERAILEERPKLAEESNPAMLLGRIKKMLGLRGKGFLISSACASSAAAMARGASLLRHGEAKAVLVVSGDGISEFVYSGFSTLLSLSETPARPFDADRSGLTLGEAAAWVLLTLEEKTDATSIVGWGMTTDAVHMTAPDRNGRGLSRAISKACAMAHRNADEIAFIAAHGTATVYSDAMELKAFGAESTRPKPIFSIKGGIGHTLGAAGLTQILIAEQAMITGIVPPTVGLLNPDPAADGWAHPSAVKIEPASLALSTNSGFGGVNTAVLLGRSVQS